MASLGRVAQWIVIVSLLLLGFFKTISTALDGRPPWIGKTQGVMLIVCGMTLMLRIAVIDGRALGQPKLKDRE